MGDNTYPASVAIRFVAVGRLQRKASRAQNLFLEDRFLCAADAPLRQLLGKRDFLNLPERIAECDIASAVVAVKGEATGLIALLVVAGEDQIARAIANNRRTVRRRYDIRCAVPPEGVRAKDRRAEIDDRLDFEAIAQRASPLHREVLLRRAQGQDDREIAVALKLRHKYVLVLVHRAIASIRKMLAN